MSARQGIRLRATNRKAKYKVKYTYSQIIRAKHNKTSTKYTYSKKIVPIRKKKYSYNKKKK